jgi:hypothetical protein
MVGMPLKHNKDLLRIGMDALCAASGHEYGTTNALYNRMIG